MEIQKPFKCPMCTSRFTNEDHLQVHKRRHEMSLNLGKGGSLTAQALESFVEETPSPTRFFRNCEEVGLFQDLQNVNPFDEQFSKATSATPSTENFEFNFSIAASTTPAARIPSLSMRRSAEQDTLNTPQVIGYPVISSTTNTSSSSITSLSNSNSVSLSTPQVPCITPKLPPQNVSTSCSSSNETNKDSIIQTSVQNSGISTTTPPEPQSPVFTPGFQCELHFSSSSLEINNSRILAKAGRKSKSKSNLRLTLTPQSASDAEASASISTCSSNSNLSAVPPFLIEIDPPEHELPAPSKHNYPEQNYKKTELLERNRAAASRSRERRKQWVSGLEARNQTLLSALAKSRTEIQRLRSENQLLRDNLARHATCDVTKAEMKSPQPQQPHILRQNTNIIMNPPISPNLSSSAAPTQSSVITPLPSVSVPSSPTVITERFPPVPTPKPKRGRPRKGQEKRAEIVCVPASVSSNCEIPVKVQILPLKHAPTSQIVTLQSNPLNT